MNKKSRTVELRRLALAQVGLGHGAGFLDALLVYGFETLNAGRVWLDTAETNLRAQKVYAGAGFTLEGRLRKHDYCPPLQQNLDTLLYGMMRDEWQASKS
jgi:RimJ/RimL family protein N-acetyltransferase